DRGLEPVGRIHDLEGEVVDVGVEVVRELPEDELRGIAARLEVEAAAAHRRGHRTHGQHLDRYGHGRDEDPVRVRVLRVGGPQGEGRGADVVLGRDEPYGRVVDHG